MAAWLDLPLRWRAGKFDIAPKKKVLKQQYEQDKDMTKFINANNESRAAGLAAASGGKLAVVKAPPPVLATADAKGKAKAAKKAAESGVQ
jgi:Protein of unknown function (DUF2462)